MKKNLVIAICIMLLACVASYPAQAEETYSISTDRAVSGHDYVLIIVDGERQQLTLVDNDDSICYIQQKTAEGNNLTFDSIQPISFQKATAFIISDSGQLIKQTVLNGTVKTMVLPSLVKSIEEEAFSGVLATVIILPNGLTSIGDKAFANCPNLEQILIPSSVNTIGSNVFSGTPNVVIYGYTSTTAESYANQNGIPFVSMNNVDSTTTNVIPGGATDDEGFDFE